MVDQQAPVALETAEGLLDFPPACLDREARLVPAPDQFQVDAVASQRGRGTLAGEGKVGPDLAQVARRQLRLDEDRGVPVLDRGRHDAQRLEQTLGVGQQHALAALTNPVTK